MRGARRECGREQQAGEDVARTIHGGRLVEGGTIMRARPAACQPPMKKSHGANAVAPDETAAQDQ
jgi:hypothetical protein